MDINRKGIGMLSFFVDGVILQSKDPKTPYQFSDVLPLSEYKNNTEKSVVFLYTNSELAKKERNWGGGSHSRSLKKNLGKNLAKEPAFANYISDRGFVSIEYLK